VGGEVVLVRHAVPFTPEPDGPDDHHRSLTAAGAGQAQRLVGELPVPALIVSSPYLRAVQTVEPLARTYGLSVRTDPALREWDSGLGPTPDYARHYQDSWDDPGLCRPGGESLDQLTARAVTALTALDAGGPVVVGSHGTFIARALVGFGVPGIDWAFCVAMPMPAVYRLRLDGKHMAVTGPGLRPCPTS
jgi:2,3-bisphosphoglycerate-dependent phosphoglycerate mutase